MKNSSIYERSDWHKAFLRTFHSTRALGAIANHSEIAVEAIEKRFYVDDHLGATNSIVEERQWWTSAKNMHLCVSRKSLPLKEDAYSPRTNDRISSWISGNTFRELQIFFGYFMKTHQCQFCLFYRFAWGNATNKTNLVIGLILNVWSHRLDNTSEFCFQLAQPANLIWRPRQGWGSS